MNKDDLKKELNDEELDAVVAGQAMVLIASQDSNNSFKMNISREKYDALMSKDPNKFNGYHVTFYEKK